MLQVIATSHFRRLFHFRFGEDLTLYEISGKIEYKRCKCAAGVLVFPCDKARQLRQENSLNVIGLLSRGF